MNKAFGFHKLNDAGIAKAEAIASIFDSCLNNLFYICPESREMAIVRTKLEEACFFAKKAMALQPANQENEDAIKVGQLPKDN